MTAARSDTTSADYDLESLLAHRPPMLLLDDVVEIGDDYAIAQVRITPRSSFFIESCGVPAWIGIEYMAQCVGMLGGAQAGRKGEPTPIGYLLGTRRFTSTVDYFIDGQVLNVLCREVIFDGNGLGAYNCRIEADGTLAESRLTVFRKSS